MNSSSLHKSGSLFIIFSMLIFLSIVSLKFGILNFSLYEIRDVLLKKEVDFQIQFVVGDVRLPRIIVGILCGAMFALSGSLLQCVLRNPMAAPDILGINSACSFFILLFTVIFSNYLNINILFYSSFGALVGFIITVLSSIENKDILQTKLIVVGVAIGALFKAFCQFIIMQTDEKLSSLVSFITGTLYPVTWATVEQILFPAFILIPFALVLYKKLDMLLLSDEASLSVGFNPTKWKIIIIFVALFLAGVSVSGSGSLGFIGLIAPNISRLIFGNFHKYNLIGSALIGATITVFSDFLGRILFFPYEIPVGIITIIIGAPYFLYLMKNVKKYS
jgi:ABC-type Fe3+-siderophore transport system permease subunit